MKTRIALLLALPLVWQVQAKAQEVVFKPERAFFASYWGEEVKTVSAEIAAARVSTLYSDPYVMLPAKPGYTYMPLSVNISHPAGTAYTGASALELHMTPGPGGVSYNAISASLKVWDGMPFQYLAYGPGTGSHYTGLSSFSGRTGRPVLLRATGGDPSGGTFGFQVRLSYAEIPSPGMNMLINSTFTGNATAWTLGLGGGAPDWAYSANTVTHGNGGGTAALEPNSALPAIVAGHSYEVTFTISGWSAGTVTPTIGGAAGTARGADGTFVETIVASTTGNLLLTPTDTLVATIDNVFVADLSAP